jgi:hypothetical protein
MDSDFHWLVSWFHQRTEGVGPPAPRIGMQISSRLEPRDLPYFELQFSVPVDHLKIGAVTGDEPGFMRSSRERNENVEMQVAELVGHESSVRVNFPRYLTRLQPNFFRRRQDGMVCPEILTQ